MALLIDIRQPKWMTEEALHDELAPLLPGVTIHCGFDGAVMDDVEMIAVSRLHRGVVEHLQNLKLVQKLGAGVESILTDPALPVAVRVARLAPDAPADEIAEYCLAYVLRAQRNMVVHEIAARQGKWVQSPPKKRHETTVGVLGLGHIGARTAQLFAGLGFRVIGWSWSQKSFPDVECLFGMDALGGVLSEADYVAAILPSTPNTTDLFDAAMFERMKPTAVLINAGRGTLIVEDDLILALDEGKLGGAVLDVFRQEPLPQEHPFWAHSKITVTPHVSGWHLDGGLSVVADNYKRLIAGEPLLHEIDRKRGY